MTKAEFLKKHYPKSILESFLDKKKLSKDLQGIAVKIQKGLDAYHTEIESDLDEVIKEELCEFALELFNNGELRSGENHKIAALKRVESYLNENESDKKRL